MRFSKGLKTALLTLTLTVALGISAAAAQVGTVTASRLNVRSGPSTGHGIISTLVKGTQVTVLDQTSGFYKISYGSNEGYVSADYLTLSQDDEAQTGTVTASSLNIRKAPVSGAVLTKLSRGTVVTILATDPATGWYQITLNNSTGWCSPDYIQKVKTEQSPAASSFGSQVVAEAKKYLGYRYRYGGSSPSTGFDCSGLTSYVFRQCGVKISRTASAQYKDGVPVSKEALQPGDLVFFRNSSSGSRIGHVGIYVGNGQYIHSQSYSKPVNITSLSDSWSSRYYYGACRVTG